MNKHLIQSVDFRNNDYSGLFDKIINIKFTRKNGEVFTIRSDYEPVFFEGKLYFKTCQPKPEIRVQFTQYQATMINIDIFITNFNVIENIQTSSDLDLINAGEVIVKQRINQGSLTNQPNNLLTRLGNTVVKAEIEMGYRNQFFNWAQYSVDPLKIQETYNAFINLTLPQEGLSTEEILKTQSFFKAQRRCSVVIEWATNISNPPDRVTQFHGYVGTTDAGFQPFSLISLDCASEGGARGLITKEDILKGLDDEYYNIDEVKNTKNNIIGFKNYFNYGKPFTLLEGYCFHMVTRRFIRSNVDIKRNELLEEAALNYITNSSLNVEFDAIKLRVEQSLYNVEYQYFPQYFTKTKDNLLQLSDKAPDDFKEKLRKSVISILVEYFVGIRFTIKNLPDYRKLYLKIRDKIDSSIQTISEGKQTTTKYGSLAWWEAAELVEKEVLNDKLKSLFNVSDQQMKNTLRRTEVKIEKNLKASSEYILNLEKGEYAFKDCYFENKITGNDWIVPTQNIRTSVPLKKINGKILYFSPPKSISNAYPYFEGKANKISVKCFSGMLEIRDAYMFGVPVLCSEKASAFFEKAHQDEKTVVVNFMSDPQSQVEWICRTWKLKYYKLNNGGFYIYSQTESSRETMAQDFVLRQSNGPFKIPAIYDMTLEPVRKIRMPFISFLNPMTLVEWNSTAMIGSMISYYYQPNKGRNFFMVIKSAIDFSTTGEENIIELDLVDAEYVDPEDVPVRLLTQQEKKEKGKILYTNVVIIPDYSLNNWLKIFDSPICNLRTVIQFWEEQENKDVLFYNLFKQWNATLFNFVAKDTKGNWVNPKGKSFVDNQIMELKKETLGESLFPEIEKCMAKISNPKLKRIFAKFPLMPSVSDYSNMKEEDSNYILVYQNGLWTRMEKKAIESLIQITEE